MTTAKKVCALLMALTVLLTTGCGTRSETKDDTASAADIYIEKAQEYVDEKDYAAAIDILQLGLETIDDESLEEMLDEVIELQIAEKAEDKSKTSTEPEKDTETGSKDNTDTEKQSFDISKYVSTVTYWAAEGTDWVYGGYTLGIYISETSPDNAYFEFSYLQGAPSSRNAVASAEIPLSEITSNEVTFSFENDGWGHSGNITLVFEDDAILFAVSDVAYTDPSCPEMWGFYDVSGRLVSNPTIYNDLYYTEEEYNALFGEQEQTPQKPAYDTSKASGILASLGMTEQDFKDSCIPLDMGGIDSKTTAYYIEYKELLRYPNNYIGTHFYIGTNLHDYFPCPYCDGIDDSCSSTALMEKYDENGKHWTYRSDPNTLIPYAFGLGSYVAGISSDGYLYYETSKYLIFDFRDDVYSPNLAAGGNASPYLIFLGVSFDGTQLRFAMITCDVSFN